MSGFLHKQKYLPPGRGKSLFFWHLRRAGIFFALTIAAGGAGLPSLSAQTVCSKVDNVSPLDQTASWSPSIPSVTDTALWSGTYANGTVSIGSGLSVSKIQLGSPSQAIVITPGTGFLRLGTGGIDLSSSTQNLTVSAPLVLGANQTWSVSANRTLSVSGLISDGGSGLGLTLSGNGAVTLGGNNTYTGPTTVNTGATLTITGSGSLKGNATAHVSTGNATVNLSNSGTIAGTLTIAQGSGPASPNANEFPLIATGIAQLKGGSSTGPITNNGQLTLSDSTQIKAIGLITGTGGLGGINDNNIYAGGKTLVFADGSAFSYLKPGNNTISTLQVQGNGTVSFAYFGYNSAAIVPCSTTFDGGTWNLGKVGRGNSGAQFSGTANITNGATVNVRTSGFEHGNWDIKNGLMTFNGTISEGQGSSVQNIGLNINVNSSGGGNGTLTATGLTLGLSGINTSSENNSLTVGTGGTVTIGTGNLTVGTAFNHAAAEANTISLSGGKLVVAGTLQAASTIGANQTRTFYWAGGQLSAGSIIAAAGFNGANSTISSAGLNQTAGTLAPGDAGTAGKTSITGNYSLGAGGTLAVDLGGTTQATAFQTGQYDYLTVSGTTILGGSLAVRVLPGFTPGGNSTFAFLTSAGALSGNFTNVAFGGRIVSDNGLASFVVSKSGNVVTLGQYLPVTPPDVTTGAAPATVQQGGSITLGVSVSSLVPVTYQWRKNGIAIDGATSAKLGIYGAQSADSGTYDVVVTNSAGASTSSLFTLTVTLPRSTVGIVVDAGTSRDFAATPLATGYAWSLNGAPVGTNAATYTYAPDVNAVGTHWLQVKETYSDGSSYTRQWGVRVRIPPAAGQTKYYVSPTGSDSGDGSLGSPFLTLEKARDKVRTISRPLPAGGITVYLRGGTYYRTGSLTLNASDSGSNGAPVTYMAYPGETVVISGAKPVSASQFSPLASSEVARVAPGVDVSRIWEADLAALGVVRKGPFPNTFGEWAIYNPLGASSSGGLCELFYNGKRMHLSRYPNHDLTDETLTTNLKMNGVVAGADVAGTGYLNAAGNYTTSNGSVMAVGGAFQYNTSDAAHVARWQTAMTKGGVWVVGYWRVPWQVNGAKVGILDTGAKQVIGLASGVNISNGIGYKYSRPVGNKAEPWWVINLLEELDQPGEWCIDFSRNKLYFLMDAAGAPANNSVALSDLGSAMVQITGSYVNIQGITFEYGLGQGVQVTGGSRNLVTGCTFRNMGGYPVEFNNISGGTYNGVVSCDMSNLASGGVLVRGGNNTLTPRVPTNNFVVNNRIQDFARVVRVYAAAVDVGFQYGKPAVGVRVAHNAVSGSPHVGMLWKDYDHVFEYNDISDYCQFSDDMGGIYTFASNYVSNTTIRYNYLHDSDHGEGVYFDSDHINATVYGNVANLKTLSTESRGYGFYDQVPGGTPASGVPLTDTSFNNIAVNCHFGFQYYSAQGGTIENNLAFKNTSSAFKWNLVAAGNGTYTNTSSNSTVTGSGPNMAYTTDPGFVDFANDDLRLRPDSAAYTDMPGLQQIPLEMAGVYNDEFRSDATVYAPFITSNQASNLGSNVATFNGTLAYPQFDANASVLLYWGTTDGGADPSAWHHVEDLGTPGSGTVSKTLTSLLPGTQYFYRFCAVNSAGTAWAEQTNSATTYPANSVATGGTATASSSTTPVDNAFDANPATIWQSSAGVVTGWIQYQFAGGAAVAVTQYQITSAADNPARDPKDWEFLGSDDGLNWTILDTQTGQVFATRSETKSYGFSNSRPYKNYRLNITANNGDSAGLQLADLQLGAPSLTPDTTGPAITTPGNLVVAAGSSNGAYVDYVISAIDAVSGVATPIVNPVSGSLFPIGSTPVNVTATDAAGNTSSAGFTVTVTPPALPNPWTIRNVGTYNSLGTATFNDVTRSFTINATGGTSGTTGDIWTGNNDNFTYISQPWSGDGIFTARVASFTSTDASAKAGIMVRETTNVGSKYGFTYFLRKGDAWSQHKTATSGSTSNVNFFSASSTGKGIPYWIRLVRKGNVFTSFISSNGTAWTQLGNATTNALAAGSLTVGFAVGPRTASGNATASFDNVTFLGVPPAPSGLVAAPASAQVGLTWNPVAGADSYTVKRSDASGGPFTTIASGLASPAYVDSALDAGVAVYYVVTAVNAAGEGPAGTEISAAPFTAIQAWRFLHFKSETSSGSAADTGDPDGDGLCNLIEYALGTSPVSASPDGMPTPGTSGGKLTLSFFRALPDVTYYVDGSSDLTNWSVLESNPGVIGQRVTVIDTIDISSGVPPRRFLRLRVTNP